MKTKKEIIKFLEELVIGVQGKRDKELKKCQQLAGSIDILSALEDREYWHTWKEMYNYTDGQLYEINYILETITRK